MPLVTDLANFLSTAEVKTVTRYQKPNKMTHTCSKRLSIKRYSFTLNIWIHDNTLRSTNHFT